MFTRSLARRASLLYVTCNEIILALLFWQLKDWQEGAPHAQASSFVTFKSIPVWDVGGFV